MERVSLENDHLEGANNVYLFDTAARTVLVDTGEHSREATLRSVLRDRGVAFADVDEILLTHWHPDHSGLAGMIQDESGATVRAHERDAPLASGDEEAWTRFGEGQQSRLEAWGIPAAKREQLFDSRDQDEVTDRLSIDEIETLTDGETIQIGDHRLEVRHTPGHTAGSICFELDGPAADTAGGTDLVAGDTLLPNYTPNVGGSDSRLESPLDAYLASLHGIAAADYDRGWPGHRGPIADPSERAQAISAHHEQRAGRILGILNRIGPADVWSVGRELFGELEEFHILVGAGEAYAHLRHLEEQGDVVHDDGRYRVVDDVQAALDGDVDTWPLSVGHAD